MSKVVAFCASEPLANPDATLEIAKGAFEDVLIIGFDAEGYLQMRSSAGITAERALWLVEQFKFELISGEYAE